MRIMLVLNAVLLDLLLLLLLLWSAPPLCSSHGPEVLAPLRVEFHSQNFRNVLRWRARVSGPDHLHYCVQYKVYGDPEWSECEHCQNIQRLQCDLSQETSDPRQWYYARVHALNHTRNHALNHTRNHTRNHARNHTHFSTGPPPSPWVVSARFHPQWDTVFSPPQIRLKETGGGILVQMRPPRSPLLGKRSGRISITRLQRLSFRIYLQKGDEETIHETTGCSRKLLIQPLESGTTYCAQAVTVVTLSGVASSRSPRSCISTS